MVRIPVRSRRGSVRRELPQLVVDEREQFARRVAYGARGDLWVVNTRFSCLCTLDRSANFAPRWRPPFVSALEPSDRCHLNGLGMADGRPRYVTALGDADEPAGGRTRPGTAS